MTNNLPHEKNYVVYKRKKRFERHLKERARKRKKLFLIISLGLIFIASFYITYNMYISSNSKDLGFAVEHSFTTGFSSKNKLLRVQKMSLIYCNDDTAVVEASGLLKDPPHKSTSVKGNFRKDSNNSWHLEKLMLSN